ncbi:histone H2B-like [Pelobates cultripes]|uniref:Histone H2B-like n=1 Tax=Pelobates cultripes TaxID=61616 RepID=A0AAD1WC61_PELCU|nr:histone H2B-like [Pelobates cultripes]
MKPVVAKKSAAAPCGSMQALPVMVKPKKSYSKHLYRIVKQVLPEATQSQTALDCLNKDMLDSERLHDIAAEAARLSLYNMRHAITSQEVNCALRLVSRTPMAGDSK